MEQAAIPFPDFPGAVRGAFPEPPLRYTNAIEWKPGTRKARTIRMPASLELPTPESFLACTAANSIEVPDLSLSEQHHLPITLPCK